MSGEAVHELTQIVLQRLESLQRAGVLTLPKASAEALPGFSVVSPSIQSSPAAESLARPAAPPPLEPDMARAKVAASSVSVSREFGKPLGVKARATALETLKCEVEQCQLCPALVKNRTQTVFGVGNPSPRVVFFGEAPGADEDRTGEPFVGRAGQLLTKIIEACSFKREDVYIMNVLKCRPPDNRTPEEPEVEKCRPFFERQLEIVRPEYIVCAGAVPMKALFPAAKSVGQMRGKFHDYQDMKVVITYHPAYLLRNPDAKKFVWDDMKMLLAEMGIPLPKPSK